MSASRGQLAHGYVLHTRPWRNTSMLVEAFTADAGRLGLVARGVRRRGSTTRACLEPFQPLLLSWSGRGELYTLTAVEAERWRAAPSGPALLAAFYCNELIVRLLGREDVNGEAFGAYDVAVTALASGEPTAVTLRRFELELLDALGFAPPLAVDAESGQWVDPDAQYDFFPEHGPIMARGPASDAVARVPGSHLLALATHRLEDPEVLRSALRVLRASLAPLLGSKPLKSRELYRSMYRGER